MTTIIPVHGTPGLVNVEGEFIAVKPLCEALGIQAHGQYEKLKGKSWATTQIICAVGADGKTREMFSIHKDNVAMWLANIDENRVKEEVRPTLIAYQKETAQALNEYFTKGVAVRKPKSQLEQLAEAVLLSQQIIEKKDQQIKELEPKASVHDKVLDKGSSLGFRQIAATLRDDFPDLTEPRLKEIMRDEGLIQKKSVDSTAKARTSGFALDVAVGTHGGKTRTQTRWTSAGLQYLILRIEDRAF